MVIGIGMSKVGEYMKLSENSGVYLHDGTMVGSQIWGKSQVSRGSAAVQQSLANLQPIKSLRAQTRLRKWGSNLRMQVIFSNGVASEFNKLNPEWR